MKKLSLVMAMVAMTISGSAFAGTKITASIANKNTVQIRVRYNKNAGKYTTHKSLFSNIGTSTQKMVASVNCLSNKYGMTKLDGRLYSLTSSSKKYFKSPDSWTWKNKKGLNGLTWTFIKIKANHINEPGGVGSAISTGLRKDGAGLCNILNKGGKHSSRSGYRAKTIKFSLDVWCKKKSGIIRPTSKKKFYRTVRVLYRCEGK